MQFWSIVWRWRKLLQNFPSYSSCRLLHSDYRRVPKVTLHKEHHLFVAHENLITTYAV
jgi:hypothetical protein